MTETLSGETRQGEPKATTGQQRREESVLAEKRRDTMRVKNNYRRKRKTLGKREAAFQGPPRARNAGKQNSSSGSHGVVTRSMWPCSSSGSSPGVERV